MGSLAGYIRSLGFILRVLRRPLKASNWIIFAF